MNTDQYTFLKASIRVAGALLLMGLIAGCGTTEVRYVKQRNTYVPRHIRYEGCVSRFVKLDMFKADGIEALCNQAHGRRE